MHIAWRSSRAVVIPWPVCPAVKVINVALQMCDIVFEASIDVQMVCPNLRITHVRNSAPDPGLCVHEAELLVVICKAWRFQMEPRRQWSSLAGFGGYKQKPYPTLGYPGYPMGPTSILGSPSTAEVFGTSISRIICRNECIEYKLRPRFPN
jgi:hypothetical protein